jgi:hypothetical protein
LVSEGAWWCCLAVWWWFFPCRIRSEYHVNFFQSSEWSTIRTDFWRRPLLPVALPTEKWNEMINKDRRTKDKGQRWAWTMRTRLNSGMYQTVAGGNRLCKLDPTQLHHSSATSLSPCVRNENNPKYSICISLFILLITITVHCHGSNMTVYLRTYT